MRRRTFLKLVGLLAAALGLPTAGSAAASSSGSGISAGAASAAATGLSYRGSGGRIYVSSNAGRSWKLHTYLGPEYDVTRVASDGAGSTALTVAYRGRTFGLTLAPDLRSWLTF